LITATWSEWVAGDCSASCGTGTVTSTRTCSGLGDCDGEADKSEACNKGACGKYYLYNYARKLRHVQE
tara:strand:- start:282 stop:485 length:204 start_codon:yes stop_codon:yes gene_type:complete